MAFEHELNIALEAVQAAGQLTGSVQNELRSSDVVAKDDRSPVTIADFGSQAVITRCIHRAFPDDVIVGEEDDHILSDDDDMMARILTCTNSCSPISSNEELLYYLGLGKGNIEGAIRYWTLDPIDGTKGFLRGDHYAVALALIEEGQVVLGILGCPTLDATEGSPGSLYHSMLGNGAYVRSFDSEVDQPVKASILGDITRAVMCESVESGHVSHDFHSQIVSHLGLQTSPFRIDSQCKYAVVAQGQASIYLRRSSSKGYREKIWDHAAGSLIVSEAGGCVTDFRGTPLDFSADVTLPDREGIVATSGDIHGQVIDAIQRTLAMT